MQPVVDFVAPLVSERKEVLREFVQSLYDAFKAAATAPLILKAADEVKAG